MKIPFVAGLVGAVLYGCVSLDELAQQPGMPGYISERVSTFDGSREVTVEPAWLLDSTNMQLGLYWRSPMKNKVILVAAANGAYNFDPDSNIRFRIDGDLVELPPARARDFGDVDTKDFGTAGAMNQSSKSFLADQDLIERILSARTVLVRAELLNSYIEGRFSLVHSEIEEHQLAETLAHNAFVKFYAQVWGEPEYASD